jgi:hypothetical protein
MFTFGESEQFTFTRLFCPELVEFVKYDRTAGKLRHVSSRGVVVANITDNRFISATRRRIGEN